MKTTLAERLTQAMTARNFSQGALAKASGIAQPTIWRLANGQAHGSRKLVDIANAMSVSVDWLANGTGEMDPAEPATSQQPPGSGISPGGVIPARVWDQDGKKEHDLSVPEAVNSPGCRAYMISRSSGCAEAPAGTIVVIDTAEKPGNGDLVYARVNASLSVYRFLDGGNEGFLAVDDARVPLIDISSSAELIGVAVFLLRDLRHGR